MEEIWKDIYFKDKGKVWDYRGIYQVSNLGNLRSVERKIKSGFSNTEFYTKKSKIRHQQLGSQGYKIIRLSKNCATKTKRVHRIIAKIFIPNLQDKPCVNHIDGNKANNNIKNLEWVSYSENNQHAVDNGLRNDNKTTYQYDEEMNLLNEFNSLSEASRKTNIHKGNMGSCARGERKLAGGYIWKYERIENNEN